MSLTAPAIIFARARWRFMQHRPLTSPTWSTQINHTRNRTPQIMGMLCHLMNRKFDLYVRNGVLLYQLIRLMMGYDCPARRSTVRTHFQNLKFVTAKCLRLANDASSHVTGRCTRIWAFRYLPTSEPRLDRFDSKLADVLKPLVRQIGRYDDRGFTPSRLAKD